MAAHDDNSDLEVGRTGEKTSPRRGLGGLFQVVCRWRTPEADSDAVRNGRQIEDYPAGYPRYSTLIASHESFHVCRRFSVLRGRLLLLKQDKLSTLEKQLEQVDREEKATLFLGSARRDKNEERHRILSDIDAALLDYDSFLERQTRIMRFDPAPRRATSNLENWTESSGCIAREETAYLGQDDLISLSPAQDDVVLWLQALVEDGRAVLERCFGGRTTSDGSRVSRDPNVHIFRPSSVARVVGLLGVLLTTVLLLAPVIVCNFVEHLTARLVIVVAATSIFIAVLSSFTKARPVELIVAGATYTTVLVVFISNADGIPP